jgi:hypothetical protein
MAGRPRGAENKDKPMRDALRIVAAEQIDVTISGRRMKMRKDRAAAMALFDAAIDGDVAAVKEINDRLDGKVTQHVKADGEVSGSFTFTWKPPLD